MEQSGVSCRDLREETLLQEYIQSKFDPFQVFEVDHEACLHIEITVHKGEGITKGSYWKDAMDTPDPYVVLRIPGSSNPSKRTSHIDNSVSPLWEETFHFYIDPGKVKLDPMETDPNKSDLQIIVSLMDANYTVDEALGEDFILLSSLVENEVKNHIFTYVNGSKVHTTILLQKNKNPDLRFSLSLCEDEKAFLRLRREKVRVALNELLGKRGPQTKEQVPIVAILGSGGGFRAMICLSGVIRALHKSGIMNCAMFISGLSGSSWLISTLYAHDKFPNISYDEIYEELKESVTSGWKSKLLHGIGYAHEMITKHRRGQPVSFTDFFGHLLGDVLLKGKKRKKLSDQQQIVSKGMVPFPIYTCLHAKASLSCKSFSEWVEFSPFEIGIAKYGTFMKTEDFGNKFIVGKIIKRFPEFPLHYLQGVWGSAFTILVKRLIDGKSGMDMVQMMRHANDERALNEGEQLEELERDALKAEEQESDTDDDCDIEGKDDAKTSSDDEQSTNNGNHIKLSKQHPVKVGPPNTENAKGGLVSAMLRQLDKLGTKSKHDEEKKTNRKISNDNTTAGNEMIFDVTFKSKKKKDIFKKTSSVDRTKKDSSVTKEELSEKKSKSLDQTAEMEKSAFPFNFSPKTEQRKVISQSDPVLDTMGLTNLETRRRRMQKQGAVSLNQISQPPNDRWAERRKQRQSQRESKNSLISSLLENTNILNSRAGRAGEILNPFRGLSLRNSFPLSPFTQVCEEDHDNMEKMTFDPGCRYDSLDNNAKKLFIVDSGLAFNSPYPLLLRPQRAVDIYLSFDFSQRPSDDSMPFKELIIAENWANQNKVRFPPIEKLAKEFSKDPEVKEVYVFENPKDPLCPVILHFPLVNNNFKLYKEPGVKRETAEEFDFADFPIFDDKDQCFSSTNFLYNELQYERLVKLMEFNTYNCLDTIKENLIKVIENKNAANKLYFGSAVNKLNLVLKAKRIFKSQDGIRLKVNTLEGKRLMKFRGLAKTRSDSGNSTADDDFKEALDHVIEEESEEEELFTPSVQLDDMNKFEYSCN